MVGKRILDIAREAKGALGSKAEDLEEEDEREAKEESELPEEIRDLEFFKKDKIGVETYLTELRDITLARDMKPDLYCKQMARMSKNTRSLARSEFIAMKKDSREEEELEKVGLDDQARQKKARIHQRKGTIEGMLKLLEEELEEAVEYAQQNAGEEEARKLEEEREQVVETLQKIN